MEKIWRTARREFDLSEKTLVMAILNVTPDSFSDGGAHFSTDEALKRADVLIEEGADILDIGGESTRPNAEKVAAAEEIRRVVPVIQSLAKRCGAAISIDTSKAEVAEAAIDAGAEIINDISGLRFDESVGEIAAKYRTGLILMHLRGTFETMHKQKPVENIFAEVARGFRQSIEKAQSFGVENERIALDVGIGFSKTFEQNLELIAKLDKLAEEFKDYPLLVGASRKSFLGKILGETGAPLERTNASLAAAALAVWNGARIVRVHDVKATVETLKVVEAVKKQR